MYFLLAYIHRDIRKYRNHCWSQRVHKERVVGSCRHSCNPFGILLGRKRLLILKHSKILLKDITNRQAYDNGSNLSFEIMKRKRK